MTSSNWLLLSKLSHLNNILYEVLNCLLLKSNFIYQNIKIKLKENSKNKRCSMLIKSNCLLTSRCSRSTCSGTDGCPWGTSHRTAGPPAPGTYSRASGAGTTAPSSGETEQLHESQPLNSWFLKHQYWTFITWKKQLNGGNSGHWWNSKYCSRALLPFSSLHRASCWFTEIRSADSVIIIVPFLLNSFKLWDAFSVNRTDKHLRAVLNMFTIN